MKLAEIEISSERIRQILFLPNATDIVDARVDEARRMVLTVTHEGLRDVPNEQPIPRITPMYQRALNGGLPEFLGWGQGEDDDVDQSDGVDPLA